jgi:hypothetical protein
MYGVFAISKITYFLVPESTKRFQLVMFLIDDAQLTAGLYLPVVQHQTVSSLVPMVKSHRYQEIQPSLGCPEVRGSVAHPGTIQASS